MSDLNHNTSPRLYNPKANAPALYIPAWLSQVPNSELKYQSKLVYGRLAQWSSTEGRAHRSAKQLSYELGMPERTVERSLQELRDVNLIGTFLPRDGGHNHFEFYDHPWMYRPLNPNLCYVNNNKTPSAQLAVPSAQLAVPSAYQAEHKIKEIKEIKEIKDNPDFSNQGKKKVIPDYKKDERFMRFYNAYPKKEDPRDAYKAFKSIVGNDDELLEQILQDIENRKSNHSQWSDKQYIKYPAVYLRKGEFEGEIINFDDEAAKKKEAIKKENELKIKKQEELSRKREEELRIHERNKQQDAVAYRSVQKTIKSMDGLRQLKHSVGLK